MYYTTHCVARQEKTRKNMHKNKIKFCAECTKRRK
nr:MAG TPA: hypothetical protein [Caudoviricetes sp.]